VTLLISVNNIKKENITNRFVIDSIVMHLSGCLIRTNSF